MFQTMCLCPVYVPNNVLLLCRNLRCMDHHCHPAQRGQCPGLQVWPSPLSGHHLPPLSGHPCSRQRHFRRPWPHCPGDILKIYVLTLRFAAVGTDCNSEQELESWANVIDFCCCSHWAGCGGSGAEVGGVILAPEAAAACLQKPESLVGAREWHLPNSLHQVNGDVPPLSPQSVGMYPVGMYIIMTYSLLYSYCGCTLSTKSVGIIIIIIDNFCIALFSGVLKLTALYNILQHFLSFTNIIHIIMTTNNV